MFPVYVYEQDGMELPQEGTYYVVAANGIFLHKDTGLVRCFIPVKNISILADLNTEVSVGLNLPKLPAQFVQKVKQFFAEVVAKHRTEASTTLYFNKETSEFKVHVSQQYVSHGGVRYSRKLSEDEAAEYEGFLRVGTIHSHCDFMAFHSGVDTADEEDFDGLHVTFGHNDKEAFTITASVVVNGHRNRIDPCSVLDGIDHTSGENYILVDNETQDVSLWMEKVSTQWPELRNFYAPKSNVICKGCEVEWAGELRLTGWRQKFGDGPFVVESVEDGYLSIQTKEGLAHFSEALFRKVK